MLTQMMEKGGPVMWPLLLLSVTFQLNIAFASENIIGTWQGDLSLGSGNKITLQFLIQKDIDDAYSVVLSLPDKAGTEDIEASQVVFSSGKLTFEVSELRGSYDGMLTDGKIVGQWQQEGEFIPFSLSRFELLPLSDEDKEKLIGKWVGRDVCMPGIIGAGGVYIFEFGVDEGKNFTGVVKTSPPDGKVWPSQYEITEMGKSEDDFIFKIPSIHAEFSGRFVGKEIVGDFKQMGFTRFFTITKGEFRPNLHTKSDLPDSTEKFLLGKWNGKIERKSDEPIDPLQVLFEFEKNEAGDFEAHTIIPDPYNRMYPIKEAIINNGKLILKTENFDVQFEMKLSGNTLTGEWNQCGVSYPLYIVKEGI